MEPIDLPRPLEDYFAFAEVERRAGARRFCITLPYLHGARLDRLQWWWRVGEAEEALLGEQGLMSRRHREVERFRRHIGRWLVNTGQRLEGQDPIPRIVSVAADLRSAAAGAEAADPLPASASVSVMRAVG